MRIVRISLLVLCLVLLGTGIAANALHTNNNLQLSSEYSRGGDPVLYAHVDGGNPPYPPQPTTSRKIDGMPKLPVPQPH